MTEIITSRNILTYMIIQKVKTENIIDKITMFINAHEFRENKQT